MKSLVLFSYKQPVEGNNFRWGVLTGSRDTFKAPISSGTKYHYRWNDPQFKRSQTLDTVLTTRGPKAFYRERQNWKVKIPFIGSLLAPFLRA
jgi:hypothetical protein